MTTSFCLKSSFHKRQITANEYGPKGIEEWVPGRGADGMGSGCLVGTDAQKMESFGEGGQRRLHGTKN